jgi:hypothetical protein
MIVGRGDVGRGTGDAGRRGRGTPGTRVPVRQMMSPLVQTRTWTWRPHHRGPAGCFRCRCRNHSVCGSLLKAVAPGGGWVGTGRGVPTQSAAMGDLRPADPATDGTGVIRPGRTAHLWCCSPLRTQLGRRLRGRPLQGVSPCLPHRPAIRWPTKIPRAGRDQAPGSFRRLVP